MNTFSTSIPVTRLSSVTMTFSDRTIYAATLTLLGMLIIFAVLATVWLAILVMRAILNRGSRVVKQKTPAQPPVPMSPAAQHPAAAPHATAEDPGAILAAITAAIAVVWENEHPGTGFRVVSYRRAEKHTPWNHR